MTNVTVGLFLIQPHILSANKIREIFVWPISEWYFIVHRLWEAFWITWLCLASIARYFSFVYTLFEIKTDPKSRHFFRFLLNMSVSKTHFVKVAKQNWNSRWNTKNTSKLYLTCLILSSCVLSSIIFVKFAYRVARSISTDEIRRKHSKIHTFICFCARLEIVLRWRTKRKYRTRVSHSAFKYLFNCYFNQIKF